MAERRIENLEQELGILKELLKRRESEYIGGSSALPLLNPLKDFQNAEDTEIVESPREPPGQPSLEPVNLLTTISFTKKMRGRPQDRRTNAE